MNVTEFSSHSTKADNIQYFVQLIRIAIADDIISNNEKELLYRVGEKLGFTDPEIDNLVETTGKSDFIPPYELSKRFAQVYDVVKMTMVDGIINKNEMRLASGFAVKSNFNENEIPALLVLIIHGIKDGKDEEELFKAYLKERKSRK
jgi:hypothetical protein